MTSGKTFVVRDARHDERERVRDLTVRAYAEYAAVMEPASWTGLAQAIDRALTSSDSAERIVADDGNALVGSVMLYPASANAYGDMTGTSIWPEVRLLAVPPETRGRGVARALMTECIRRATASGAGSVGIHTSYSMRVAMQMYLRMGFVRAPEHDFQPAGAEVVEAYRLPLV